MYFFLKKGLFASLMILSVLFSGFALAGDGGNVSVNDGNDSASLSGGTAGTMIFLTEKQGLIPKSAGDWLKIEPTSQEVKIMAKIDPSDKKKLIDFKKTVLRATIVKARTDMIFDLVGQKVDLTVKLDPTTKMWNKSGKSLVITGQKLHFTAKLDPAIAKLLEQHKQGFIGAKTHIISDLTGQEMQLIIKLEPMNKTWKEHEKPMLKVDARTGDRLKVKMLKYTYSPESVGTIGQGMKFEPVLRADTRTDDSLKVKMLKYAILNISLDPIKAKTGLVEHDKSLIFFEPHKLSALGKIPLESAIVTYNIAA